MNKINKGTIEKWDAFYDGYPELEEEGRRREPHFHLIGELNGKSIMTSRVLKIENGVAETRNSLYTLGWPHDSAMTVMEERWKEMFDVYTDSITGGNAQ